MVTERILKILTPLSFLFILTTSHEIHSQNHWDGILPEKAENQEYFVFAEDVNIRKETNLKSEVIIKLQPGDKVKILKKTNVLLTQGNMKEYWYYIKSASKEGYVWGSLLADSSFVIANHLILIRNPGAAIGTLEMKSLKSKKVLSTLKLKFGPVANESWSLDNEGKSAQSYVSYDGKAFSPNPGELFGYRFLVYSEIEYGYNIEKIFSLGTDGTLREFYTWYPGNCDPPSCVESWLVFPNQTLTADPNIKRVEIKSSTNIITLVSRSYDIEDPSSDSITITKQLWTGKSFQEKK